MELAALLMLVGCYGAVIYLTWVGRTPLYMITLVAGHLSALLMPLWQLLYGIRFSPELALLPAIAGQSLPSTVLISAGWYYPLPAIIVLFLSGARWWFPGRITALLTYALFVLYHLLIEMVGLRTQLWSYSEALLPFGISLPLMRALMASLVSYALLYILFLNYRSSWQGLLLSLLPLPLIVSLLAYGLLGAPLWVARLLEDFSWVLNLGTLLSLGLLIWAGLILVRGVAMLRMEP
jgi:hypothetical protein